MWEHGDAKDLLRRVVVDKEVVMDLPPGHNHRRLSTPCRRQEGLPIPTVEGAMVTGFPACREDEVVRNLIAAAKPVICIDASSRAVEKNISVDSGLDGLGLWANQRGKLGRAVFSLVGYNVVPRGQLWCSTQFKEASAREAKRILAWTKKLLCFS